MIATIVDPIGTHQHLKPTGFWQVGTNLAVAQYSLCGKRPHWLKRTLVRWAMGWTWVDFNATSYTWPDFNSTSHK